MSLDDDIRNIGRIPLLAELEPEAQRLIAFGSETRILRAGDVLFRRGEKSDCGYIVQSGSVFFQLEEGGIARDKIFGPNTLIGETALLTETERPATAIAREPCTILQVPRTLFHRVLREYPASAQILRRRLSSRLEDMIGSLERATSNDLPGS